MLDRNIHERLSQLFSILSLPIRLLSDIIDLSIKLIYLYLVVSLHRLVSLLKIIELLLLLLQGCVMVDLIVVDLGIFLCYELLHFLNLLFQLLNFVVFSINFLALFKQYLLSFLFCSLMIIGYLCKGIRLSLFLLLENLAHLIDCFFVIVFKLVSRLI